MARFRRTSTFPRDTLLGVGLLLAFAVLVICSVWPLRTTSSTAPLALSAAVAVVAAGLGRALWRPRDERALLAFPLVLFVAELVLAALTGGTSDFSGFFALAAIYVGLTQQRRLVAPVVAVAVPCWLVVQEHVDGRVLGRAIIAATFWLVVGRALASRSEISRARTEELLERANTDALTGLASRLHLTDQIEAALGEARRRGGSLAESSVMVIDLDGFKAVNDMFGHAVGDELLVEIAQCIKDSFRPTDLCARLGGDEFAVLLRDTSVAYATHTATRLLRQLSQPIELPRGTVAISASVGIASLNGAADAQEVLREADLAMYDAKATGRNRSMIYDASMGRRREARLLLESELRLAVRRQQFELHYQPVVHLRTGSIVGTEALLRWNHPQRGLLAPEDFLSTSEEIGVMVSLGDWILHEACSQAARWQPIDPAKAVSMAVNISPAEVLAAGFATTVRDALRDSGLPPTLLILEITERLIAGDLRVVEDRIRELRDLGVRVAIDDFGTGHSAIASLRNLPIDMVKIDESFIADLGRDSQAVSLAKAMVAIGEALGMDIVVEGVERPEQLELLRSFGCDVAQGFLFGRPQSGQATADLLREDRLRVRQLRGSSGRATMGA